MLKRYAEFIGPDASIDASASLQIHTATRQWQVVVGGNAIPLPRNYIIRTIGGVAHVARASLYAGITHGGGILKRHQQACTLLCTIATPMPPDDTLALFALPAENDAAVFLSPWPELHCAFGAFGNIKQFTASNNLKEKLALYIPPCNPPWNQLGWSVAERAAKSMAGICDTMVCWHGAYASHWIRQATQQGHSIMGSTATQEPINSMRALDIIDLNVAFGH